MTTVMKIPKNAKKVFDGVIFDTYHWDQQMYDGSTAKFEMLKRPDTIQVIATMDNKVLLIYEEQPTIPAGYGVIGGRIDEGETPLECAKRELLEETGLVSDDWELLETKEPYSKIEWTIHRFVARDCKKQAEQKLDAGEKIELQPVSFEKFVELAAGDEFRSTDITTDILRMYYHGTLEEFKKRLFK